jgi:enoyl-CoA hydratase/carnithine racemase
MSANPNAEVMETQLRREGGIAILTINNVARRNAFSEPVKLDFMKHLKSLISDKSCRAIVVTGAGGVFCSGGDVKTQRAKAEAGVDFMSRRLSRLGGSTDIVTMLVSGPKPVVTAVEGPAFGVGLGYAVSSDYTVAASNARFAVAQVRRGLCPDGLMYYTLTARCGPGRARELMLSGREFNAQDAEKFGVVHEITAPGKALEAAMVAAERFAAVPPLAFALTKSAMTHSYHTLEACFRAEQDYQPIVGLSKDHKESVAAFLEKRKPVYTGE